MSNSSFDTVATTLQNLKDIVDRNHSQAGPDTSLLVQDMERLIEEMRAKAHEKKMSGRFVIEPQIVIPTNSAPIQVY